ncbi:hypothetical protein OROMI_002933 [Orobanche minor]
MVRDVLADVFTRSGVSVKKEAPVNFLTDPTEGRSTLKPADVLIFGWVSGKHICVDVTGVSPLVGLGNGGFNVGQAALKAASCKQLQLFKLRSPTYQKSRRRSKSNLPSESSAKETVYVQICNESEMELLPKIEEEWLRETEFGVEEQTGYERVSETKDERVPESKAELVLGHALALSDLVAEPTLVVEPSIRGPCVGKCGSSSEILQAYGNLLPPGANSDLKLVLPSNFLVGGVDDALHVHFYVDFDGCLLL